MWISNVTKKTGLALAGLMLVVAAPVRAQQVQLAGEAQRAERSSSRLRLTLEAAGVYDSNIGHDAEEIQSIGSVTSGGLEYTGLRRGVRYGFEGGAALHRYTQSDRFDRIGALAAARIEAPLFGPLSVGLVTEGFLNGSDEDRVLTDQVVISPRLIFRSAQGGQLRIYGAQRFRRSDFDDFTSNNRYLAAAVRTPGRNIPYLDVGSRYEINDTDLETNRFNRWLHSLRLTVPLGTATEIAARLQYLDQSYPDRPLDSGNGFRRDRKWTPQFTFVREVFNNLELDIAYEFERRNSNEIDEDYGAHNVKILTRYRW
jgi:hypothetical protein